jgi:hypothetical protein
MNYNTPNSFTANISGIVNATLAANASNVALNFSTMFPDAAAPIAFGIQEITGTVNGPTPNGFKLALASAGAQIPIGSPSLAGKIEWIADQATTPPTVYLSNVSASLPTIIQFYVLSN